MCVKNRNLSWNYVYYHYITKKLCKLLMFQIIYLCNEMDAKSL